MTDRAENPVADYRSSGMKTVWKFAIDLNGYEVDKSIEVPRGSTVVHVRELDTETEKKVEFWVEVEPANTVLETREFYLAGTGHRVDSSAIYRGTAVFRSIGFVGHLYETARRA